MAFKNKKASRKRRTERASVILRGVINRIRNKIESKIRGKVEERARELKLDLKDEEVRKLVEREINKILATEKSAIEIAAKTAIAKPDRTDEAVGGVLERVEAKLDQLGTFPIPVPVSGKHIPEPDEFEGKTLKIKDVASIEDSLEDPTMHVRSNGIPGISLCIIKKEKADAIRKDLEEIDIEVQDTSNGPVWKKRV